MESTPDPSEGKTCTRCSATKPRGDFPPKGGICRRCHADYAERYRKENREKYLASAAASYQKNREQRIANAIEYAKKNPPDLVKVREWDRLRMAALREGGETCSVDGCGRPIAKVALRLCAAHARRHYKGEPLGEVRKRVAYVPPGATCSKEGCDLPYYAHDLCKKHMYARRHQENPDYARAASHRRRALLESLPSEPYTLADILARDGMDCVLCGEALDLTLRFPEPGFVTIDHLECVSWPNSAGDVLTNVAAAHLRCNIGRKNRPHPAAARKRAQLLADAERGEFAA